MLLHHPCHCFRHCTSLIAISGAAVMVVCLVWQALEDAITQQHEQERSIENEIEAYRKDIVREQIRNEQLTAVMTKLEGESGFLRSQNDTTVKKQEKLQVAPGLPS